jgi:hypothetical protein
LPGKPDWECKTCGNFWFDPDDPERIRREKFYEELDDLFNIETTIRTNLEMGGLVTDLVFSSCKGNPIVISSYESMEEKKLRINAIVCQFFLR